MPRRQRTIYQFGSIIITTTDGQFAYLGFREPTDTRPIQITRWTAARVLVELRKIDRASQK